MSTLSQRTISVINNLEVHLYPIDRVHNRTYLSLMGNAKTELLKPATDFIFEVNEGNLKFVRIEPILFELDLILIDSFLPQILAAMLIKAHKDGVCKFGKLLDWLEKSNPLKVDQSLGHKYYEYKLRRFLMSFADKIPPHDYRSQPSYILENAEITILNAVFIPNKGELLITMGIKIEFD